MNFPVVNSLSVDVEDWFHPELVRGRIALQAKRSRIELAIEPLLCLLDHFEVKATFFFLGEVASGHPALVKRLYDDGHEIACHGMSHDPLWSLGREGFKEGIEAFLKLMREILGEVRVSGFRAPTFSLNEKTQWALPVLRDLGFQYDASLFPARLPGNDLYGVRGAPRHPYRVSFENFLNEDPDSSFVEFPNTILWRGGLPIPLCGGFYLRVLPLWFLVRGLRRINQMAPFNLYIHPWETDPQTPRIPLGLKERWITYYGIGATLRKLEQLFRRFSFSRVDRVLTSYFGAERRIMDCGRSREG